MSDDKSYRITCDVCEGSGFDPELEGELRDCHLCEGAGYFGPDGFPIDDDEEKE